MNEWDERYRAATEEGMAAFERGDFREANPHGPATFQRERWFEGWDNAQELAEKDGAA